MTKRKFFKNPENIAFVAFSETRSFLWNFRSELSLIVKLLPEITFYQAGQKKLAWQAPGFDETWGFPKVQYEDISFSGASSEPETRVVLMEV